MATNRNHHIQLKNTGETISDRSLSVEVVGRRSEHARLIADADQGYPIILSSDGTHRVGQALLLGQPTIEAVRFVIDPAPDYVGAHPDDLSCEETSGPAAHCSAPLDAR